MSNYFTMYYHKIVGVAVLALNSTSSSSSLCLPLRLSLLLLLFKRLCGAPETHVLFVATPLWVTTLPCTTIPTMSNYFTMYYYSYKIVGSSSDSQRCSFSLRLLLRLSLLLLLFKRLHGVLKPKSDKDRQTDCRAEI